MRLLCPGAAMVRFRRSVPNPEMALAPAMIIIMGLLTALTIAGYRLMQPTVSPNPGVVAYEPPAAKVLNPGWGANVAAVETAANKVADAENAKLGLRPALLARAQSAAPSSHAADRLIVVTAPQQKARTVRSQKRQQEASGPDQSRVAQREPVAPSALAQ